MWMYYEWSLSREGYKQFISPYLFNYLIMSIKGQPYIGDNDADGDGYDDDGGYLTYDSPYKYASNYRKVEDIVKEQQQFNDANKKKEECQVPITSNVGHVLCKEDIRP